MAQEKFIHNQEFDPEMGSHSHPGQHSMRTRLESAMSKLNTWRQERTLAHDTGEDVPLPPEIEEGLVGGFSRDEIIDTELTLWESSTWMKEAARHNEIYNQSISTQEDPRLKDD